MQHLRLVQYLSISCITCIALEWAISGRLRSIGDPVKRRFVASVLALVMCFSMVPATALADTLITKVEVTVEIPKVGAADKVVKFSVPADANYTVAANETKWCDGGGYEAVEFKDGDIYGALFTVTPKDGYVLDSKATVEVNGSSANVDLLGGNSTPASQFEFKTSPALLGTIDSISLEDVPAYTVGEAPAGYSYDGTEYVVVGAWYRYDAASSSFVEMSASGRFEDGAIYELRLGVDPKDGYALSPECILTVNGSQISWYPKELGDSASIYTSLMSIDEVELLNLPTASLGDTLSVGSFEVAVPAGANYSASAVWLTYDSSLGTWVSIDAGTNVVKNGNVYRIEVEVRPKPGCEFSEPLIGKAYGAEQSFGSFPGEAWFSRDFSFCELIHGAEVSGVTKPVAGATPSTVGLSVPDDAGYYIDEALWVDENSLTPSVFEQGQDYYLKVFLKPEAGYEFARDFEVVIDGDLAHTFSDGFSAEAGSTYSLKEVLPEIRIDNVPEMKVGQASETDVSMPADANYSIAYVSWMVWDDVVGAYEPFAGVFEYGKAYCFRVEVEANSGYRFSGTETAFYVNGVVQDDPVINDDEATYMKEYATGLKAIDRVELKVDEPVDGEPVSKQPVITVVGGSGFKVVEDIFGWLIVGSQGQPIGPLYDGYLRADETYAVNIQLQAEEGYAFAEDVEVVANGVVLPDSSMNLGLKSGIVTYVFGMEGESGSGSDGSAQGGIAQSGDDTALPGLVAGMGLAAAALVFARRRMA